MKNKIITLTVCLATILFSSCNDWLTVQPKDEVVKDKVFQTEEGFWTAINGTYVLLTQIGNGGEFMNMGFYDYLANVWTVGTETTQAKIGKHMYKDASVDEEMKNIYLKEYNIIANANTLLGYIDDVNFLSKETHDLIKGEAFGIRAFMHMDIMRLWGPIPSQANQGETVLPYVKVVSKNYNTYHSYKDYMDLLIADLDTAEMLLKNVDPIVKYSNSELNASRGLDELSSIRWYYRQNRMNYYAVLAMKARAYLWMDNKTKALEYAKMVIDAVNIDGTKKFPLGTKSDISGDNRNLFCEHLFSLYRIQYNYDELKGAFHTTEDKIKPLFKTTSDLRASWWETRDDAYECNKHWVREENNTSVIRMAEMYMIYMECAPLNDANTAYNDLCIARDAQYDAMTESTRKSTITAEYYREFLAEGEVFFLNKRYATVQPKWSPIKMYNEQYQLAIPTRESEIQN